MVRMRDLNGVSRIVILVSNLLLILRGLLIFRPLCEFFVTNKLLSLSCGRRRYD